MAVATQAAMFVIERVLFASFKSWNPQLLYLWNCILALLLTDHTHATDLRLIVPLQAPISPGTAWQSRALCVWNDGV
jgi:hypothetical protein